MKCMYIGQTGASLATRISHQKSYTRAADDRKSVFAHMSSNNHTIAFDKASIVKYSNTSFNGTMIESALIYNIHPGPYALDPFIVHKIINFS